MTAADAYDPTSYHPDDVAAGNTPTDAERDIDYADTEDERDRLRALWAKLDAESGYAR